MPNVKRGFSIRVFLPEGTPEGLRLVEKSNWTGRGIVYGVISNEGWTGFHTSEDLR